MLKTLGKTTWEEIKINEVFASKNGIQWNVYLKISDEKVFYIANNREFMEYFDIGKKFYRAWYDSELYKLPKSVQRLFKEE